MKPTVTPPAGDAGEDNGVRTFAGVSSGMRTYILLLLTFIYAVNFIDRQILVVMQEAIKADLSLSDTELGLLTGFSFALFYVTAGIPIARLADRANRRNIIATALAVWSGMTALSGLAQNYLQLLLARIGVGVGEAGCSPPAHSMISSLYEPKRRASALAFYSAGLYFGVLLGYLLGGFLSETYGWRATFLILGLPGIAIALLLRFSVKEPLRGAGSHQQASLKETLAVIARLKSFPYFAFGCAMSAFVSYGTGNFLPSLMVRYHGFSPSEVGMILSLSGGLTGMIGTYLGGVLADKYGARDPRWYLWIPGLSGVLAIPFAMFGYQTDSPVLMVAGTGIAAILSTMYLGPAISVSHRLVSPHMRALMSAILFFILNLIGLGMGPVVVGMISDTLREITGEESLRAALTIAVSLAFIKAWLFFEGGRKLPQDLAQHAED